MPRVLNHYRDEVPPDAVWIMRGSKWGNPYSHKPYVNTILVPSREIAVESYAEWLHYQDGLMNSLRELRGKDLVCCCKPAACHGDVLLKLANPQNE